MRLLFLFTISVVSIIRLHAQCPTLTVTYINSTSVTVSWTPNTPAINLTWSGAGMGTQTNPINPFTLTGLTPCSSINISLAFSNCSATYNGGGGAGITATSSCPNTINTTITGFPGPWQVELKKILPTVSSPVVFNVIPSSPTFTVAQTSTGATYQLRVRRLCSAGVYSPWSTATTVNVPASCTSPTNLTSSAITNSGFTSSWTPPTCPGSILGYYFYRKPVTSSVYTSFATSSPTYVSTGLLPSTSYNYYIRGYYNCGSGMVWTQSSPVQTITTLP